MHQDEEAELGFMLPLEGGEGCLISTAFWWPIRQSPQLWGASGRPNESSLLPSSYEEPRYCFQTIAALLWEMCRAACKPPWAHLHLCNIVRSSSVKVSVPYNLCVSAEAWWWLISSMIKKALEAAWMVILSGSFGS